MYDRDIEALCILYEKKDYKAAAHALGMKETTLKSRVTALEEKYGVRILLAEKDDAIFTNAGKSLAQDALFMIRYSNSAIQKAQRIEAEENLSLKVGTSYMAPGKELVSALEKRRKDLGSLMFHPVHFFSMEETLRHLESHVDILASFYDERLLKKYSLSALEMRKERLMLAIAEDDELKAVPMLDIEDLYGRKVYIYKKGYLKAFDQLRADIMEYHKQIEIITFDRYSAELEKEIEEKKAFLATFKSIAESMPSLSLKPVLWNYSTAFGILSKKDASDKVRKVIEILKKE